MNLQALYDLETVMPLGLQLGRLGDRDRPVDGKITQGVRG